MKKLLKRIKCQFDQYVGSSVVSPGLNEVRGAHDDEQQSARPGARREARAARRASLEGAHRNVNPDAPNTNYTLIVNKRQTLRFVLLQCYVLYAAH